MTHRNRLGQAIYLEDLDEIRPVFEDDLAPLKSLAAVLGRHVWKPLVQEQFAPISGTPCEVTVDSDHQPCSELRLSTSQLQAGAASSATLSALLGYISHRRQASRCRASTSTSELRSVRITFLRRRRQSRGSAAAVVLRWSPCATTKRPHASRTRVPRRAFNRTAV